MDDVRLVAVAVVSLVLSFAMTANAAEIFGPLTPGRLRVEHLTEPLGIDVAKPRFGWELTSPTRGDVQTAYQIVVGEDRAAVQKGAGSLWDSGRVASAETIDLLYAGKPLAAHQQLFWAVRTWDEKGSPSAWSEPAKFSTGFLEPASWSAAWIGFDKVRDALRADEPLAAASWIMFGGDNVEHAPAAVRTYASEIELPAGAVIDAATLSMTADDHYRSFVNDHEVGHSEGKDAWKQVQNVDVKSALKPGRNAVRVRVENSGEGQTGLLASLVVRLQDGTEVRHVTGDGWRVSDEAVEFGSDTFVEPKQFVPARVIGKNGVKPWGELKSKHDFLPPVPMFRKTFTPQKPVRRATLYAAELGNADFYLNGKRVTDDRYGSGWTDYAKRVYYRAYDVTDRLTPGVNAMGVMLADGWFSGYVAFEHKRDRYGKKPRAAVELRVDYADGTTESFKTDDTWKAGFGATREADFLLGETYDARIEVKDWSAASFDDSKWSKADVGTDEVKPIVQWHPGQPVRAYKEFTAKKTAEPKPGVYVLDLGQNFAGISRLRVENTKPGQKIVLRVAERLNPDGTIYTTNLRQARSTDTYICRGDAVETWEPRFTFHGFQYVEITGLTAPPKADTVVGVALSSDTPVVGTFETSDAMLNQLHSNILHTQRSNFIDIPTDCPQRDERLGWTADAQVYLNAAILNADVQGFFDKWLVDLADAQRDDGQFPEVAPNQPAGKDGGPAWADAGAICPWVIYEAYGDKKLLERQYPSMKKFIEFCRKRSGDELLPPKEFHSFGDWLSINADTPKDVIYLAYFARSTKLTAKAAHVLGYEDDAKALDELFEKIKASFHKAYIAKDGRIKGDTQTCYVLAIAFDLVDGADREAAAKYLVENIEARGNHLSTGFLGTKELMLVLSQIGRQDVAFKLLHNDTFPSWGFSIKHGATSIWERWDGWTPEKGFQDPGMNSFAHYSFGAVYQWMAENIGGIHAIADSARTITIAPQIDPKLTWAKVGYHSPRGEIRTDWKVDGDRLTLNVVIPANVKATIVVPAAKADSVREGGKPVVEGAGIGSVEVRKGGVAVEVGGGDYRFESTIAR
jgi:alpha-L-rhamnosidase